MSDPIVIRRAESVEDYQACQDAQRLAWGIHEDHYVVPVATMVGAQHHGGLVLGAFLPDGRAVGLSFAFLGRIDGRLCLYSQLTGIVPGYQDQGLGRRLKAAQRAIALEENIPCITWAFDPLQAGNARFNLEKLGAVGVRFIENMYGSRSDALNLATSTDRLIVVWETSPGPERAETAPASIEGLPRLIGPAPMPTFLGLPDEDAPCLLPIPTGITSMRANAPEAAGHWNRAAREAFAAAFAANYRAVGFARDGRPSDGGSYVLKRP
jgi:predicted GNAT superfamily acetyltransferase